MIENKKKEEKIKELEEKVRVTDLKVYEKETFKKSLVKGTISGMITFAIPVSVSVASNVFGVNLNLDDNNILSMLYECLSLFPVSVTLGTIGAVLQETWHLFNADLDAQEMRKLKYFVENKEDITKEVNMNILDVEKFSNKQLKKYSEKGRSKVLKITLSTFFFILIYLNINSTMNI